MIVKECTMECGKMTCVMGKELKPASMEISTEVDIYEEKRKVLASNTGPMVRYSRVIGKMARSMDKGYGLVPLGINMKECGPILEPMEKDDTLMQMGIIMTGNGRIL